MKKFFLLFITLLIISSVPADAATNIQLVKNYARTKYPSKNLRIVPQGKVDRAFTHRRNKYVYVIKFKAKSRGTYGITKTGSYIRFNKPVKKGKWVYMYYVYNPYSNYEDDVVARIGNNKIVCLS